MMDDALKDQLITILESWAEVHNMWSEVGGSWTLDYSRDVDSSTKRPSGVERIVDFLLVDAYWSGLTVTTMNDFVTVLINQPDENNGVYHLLAGALITMGVDASSYFDVFKSTSEFWVLTQLHTTGRVVIYGPDAFNVVKDMEKALNYRSRGVENYSITTMRHVHEAGFQWA